MLLCAVFGVVQAQQVSLDFSTNDWGLPEGSANKLTESKPYTNSAGYTVTLQAADGYYFNTQGYLMLGKAESTLTLPAFTFKVSKIAVVGNSGASASVKQNIFVGEEAVSTETEGAKGTNEYVIASDKRAIGTIYTLKVLSAHNTQITQIKIYKEGDEGLSAPNLSFGSTTSFTVELGKEFTAPELTYAEGFDGTVTYTSDNTEAVEVNANTGAVTIKAVGTAKITASSEATTKFEAGEAFYTIKVVEPQGSHEVEDGTFDFTGTTDYGSGLEPSAEDITEDHTWTAGNVTLVTSGKYRWWYNASGNTLRFYNNVVDNVQTSRMTISVPSDYEITKIEIAGGRQFKSDDDKYDASKGEWSGKAQSVVLRYAASSGNVAVKTVTVTYSKKGSDATYTLTISEVENATITAYDEDGDEIASGDEVMAGANVTLTVDVEEGYELKSVSVTEEDGSDVTVTENTSDGSWTFAMPSSDVTVTCKVDATALYTSNIYEKVTSNDDLTSGTYLIVYEEGSLAFDGSLETLDAVRNTIPVTISDDKIPSTQTTDAATFEIDVDAGTIYSKSGYYIGKLSDGNGMNTSDEEAYTNEISIDENGNANIMSGNAYLRYNATSGQERFRYFKSATYTAQKAIQLYKLVEPEDASITVEITPVGYATLFYSDKNLIVPGGVVAKKFILVVETPPSNDPAPMMNSKRADESTTIEEVAIETGDIIPAGTGVVIEAIEKSEKNQTFEFAVATLSEPLEIDANNILYGSDEPTMTNEIVEGDNLYYVLSTDKNGENVGFYWGAKKGVAFMNGAHKAFLAIPKSSGVNASSFVFDELTGIRAITVDSTEGAEGVYTLSGMRIDGKQLPKGIYIVNGKKMVIK